MTILVAFDPHRTAVAAEGTQILKTRLNVKVYDSVLAIGRRPAAAKDIDVRLPWTLATTEIVTAKPVNDPALHSAMQNAFEVQRLQMDPSGNVQLEFRIGELRAAVAYKVFLRDSMDREWPLGSFTVSARQTWTTRTLVGQADGLDRTLVDVILRPDQQAAVESVDITEYWSQQVDLRNVRMSR